MNLLLVTQLHDPRKKELPGSHIRHAKPDASTLCDETGLPNTDRPPLNSQPRGTRRRRRSPRDKVTLMAGLVSRWSRVVRSKVRYPHSRTTSPCLSPCHVINYSSASPYRSSHSSSSRLVSLPIFSSFQRNFREDRYTNIFRDRPITFGP